MITFYVIHTWRLKCTMRCLSAIENTTPKPYKIRLLVQGPQVKENFDYLESLPSWVNITYLAENIGALAGRKMLMEKTEDDGYGVVLDNDIYLRHGWFQSAVKALKWAREFGKRVVRVGIVLHRKDGSVQPSASNVCIERGVFKDIIIKPPYTQNMVVDSVLDGAFIFSVKDKKLIKYDPYYKVGFGGLDMSLSLIKAGYRCVLSYKSQADHWREPAPAYYREYRHNFKEISKSYNRFMKKWNVKMPFREHFRYKYIYPLAHTTPHEWWKKLFH